MLNNRTGNLLKQRKNENGYILVSLPGEGKSYRVHRLVCETFKPECEFYGLDVNHIDGVKTNNRLDNLEWCTRSYNILHAHSIGLNNCHEETHHSAVLNNEQVEEICQCLQDGWRSVDIATKYNVSKGVVADIKVGRNWKNISSKYTFNVARKGRASIETIHRVCKLLQEGKSPAQVSKLICSSAIKYKEIIRIRNGDIWESVSKDYKIPVSDQLKEDDAAIICNHLQDGKSVREIVRLTTYSFDQVYKIYKRKSWVGVSNSFKF